VRGEIEIRLQPRAGHNRIAGERDGRLLVQVTAPAVDGRANEALCRLIAKRAGVARGKVTIVRGERSRDKLVRVEGIGEAEVRRALAG
jgi:uncharacterized protein (TIGR00251 family)